jgi:thiol-disulfide isomerase/thioredoxin
MKKTIVWAVSIFVLFLMISSCKSGGTSTETTSDSSTVVTEKGSVQVMYFHGERRCPTCVAVGEVAKESVAEYFAANAKVSFLDINIEEESNKTLAEKYEVSGSGLFVVSGAKFENITGQGFQNARSRPEVLKEQIKALVEKFLSE